MKVIYSAEFPAILASLRCTLAISTYQAGRLLFVSSVNGVNIIRFAKMFKRPMGLAVGDGGKFAIACKDTVEVFQNHQQLARRFPKDRGRYDGMFFPRATYYTGIIDLHDLEWMGDELVAVNTAFSCLCKIDSTRSFTPIWTPDFITDMYPEDRCHLNGLAMADGIPAFVSMLAPSNEKKGWRKTSLDKGVIIDVRNNEVLLDELPIPHSPRLHNHLLYYILSSLGEVWTYNLQTGENSFFAELSGFGRGMRIFGNYLFVGISTTRDSGANFVDLPPTAKGEYSGVEIFGLESGEKEAELFFKEKIEEIFDLALIPDFSKCVLLDKNGEMASKAVVVSDEIYFWKKDPEKPARPKD